MAKLDVIDLNAMEIASPCKASWNAMKGDERARFCGHCEKHVYNIAAMNRPEVIALIERTEGDFCGRLYRRRDGTVLTADCPIGAVAFSSGRIHRALTYGVIGLSFLTTGLFLKASTDRSASWPPTGPSVSFSDWWDWAWRTLGMGKTPPASPPRQGAGMMMRFDFEPAAVGVPCDEEIAVPAVDASNIELK